MFLICRQFATLWEIMTCKYVFLRNASLALQQLLDLRDKAEERTLVPNGVHGYKTLYKCPVCSRSFRGNAYLRLHMRTHTGENLNRVTTALGSYAARLGYSTQVMLLEHYLNSFPHAASLKNTCYNLVQCAPY